MLLAPPSNLEFPAYRAPGFDPTHPASPGLFYSGIAVSGSFVNLLTGAPASITGTVSAIMTPQGPGARCVTTLSGLVAATPASVAASAITFGAIITLTASIATGVFLQINGGSSSYLYQASRVLFMAAGGSTFSSGVTLALNVPYFVAVSYNGSTARWVVANLNTGQITQATTSATHTIGTLGGSTTFVSGGTSGAYFMDGQINAGMCALNNWLSAAQLLAWAADPWAFWYPDDDLDFRIVGLTSGGAQSLAGLSLSRFRGASAFTGAQFFAARAAARAPSRLAPLLTASLAAKGRAAVQARGTQGAGAFLAAIGALRSIAAGRGSPALASSLSGRSSADAHAKVAQSLTARASAASSAGFRARTSPALAALMSARTRAGAAARAIFASGAFLQAASGLAQASVRAEAVFVTTVRAVVNASLVLKAPATIRSLASPARRRLLKAISTIRNLKAPP